jgi:hypothetical protein
LETPASVTAADSVTVVPANVPAIG